MKAITWELAVQMLNVHMQLVPLADDLSRLALREQRIKEDMEEIEESRVLGHDEMDDYAVKFKAAIAQRRQELQGVAA